MRVHSKQGLPCLDSVYSDHNLESTKSESQEEEFLEKGLGSFVHLVAKSFTQNAQSLINSVAALHVHTIRDSTRPKKKQDSGQIGKKTKLPFFSYSCLHS
jgi:hypothetical protein